jgi:hypothetical protein
MTTPDRCRRRGRQLTAGPALTHGPHVSGAARPQAPSHVPRARRRSLRGSAARHLGRETRGARERGRSFISPIREHDRILNSNSAERLIIPPKPHARRTSNTTAPHRPNPNFAAIGSERRSKSNVVASFPTHIVRSHDTYAAMQQPWQLLLPP